VTRLQVSRSEIRIPEGAKDCSFQPEPQYRLCNPPSILLRGYRESLLGVERPGSWTLPFTCIWCGG